MAVYQVVARRPLLLPKKLSDEEDLHPQCFCLHQFGSDLVRATPPENAMHGHSNEISVLLFLFTLSLPAAEFKTTNTGIEIAVGSLGSFTLTYPEFEPPHKIIEVKAVSASAMLGYESGADCVVSAAKDEIGIVFGKLPSDVKSWKMTTLIDISFVKGGSWQTFLLKSAQGQSLSVTTRSGTRLMRPRWQRS